jgi:hypothetical protein
VGDQTDREREYTLSYIRDMITIHTMARQPPYSDAKTLESLVSEVSRRVQYMRALEEMHAPADLLCLSAFHGRRDEVSRGHFMEITAKAVSARDHDVANRGLLWGLLSDADDNSPSVAPARQTSKSHTLHTRSPTLSRSHSPLPKGASSSITSSSSSSSSSDAAVVTEELTDFQFSNFMSSISTFQDQMSPLLIVSEVISRSVSTSALSPNIVLYLLSFLFSLLCAVCGALAGTCLGSELAILESSTHTFFFLQAQAMGRSAAIRRRLSAAAQRRLLGPTRLRSGADAAWQCSSFAGI